MLGGRGLEGGVIEAQGRERGDRTPVCGAHHLRRQWGGGMGGRGGRGSFYVDRDTGLDF